MADDDFTPLPTQPSPQGSTGAAAPTEDFTPIPFHGPPSPQTSTAVSPIWSGSILPISQYPGQSPGWDWNAGIPGAVKSAFTLPHDVATGQTQIGSPDFIGRVTNAAAMATPGAPGIAGRAAIPSADALRAISDSQYNAARGMGVHYSVPSVVQTATDAAQNLYNSGFSPATEPKTFSLLKDLASPPPDAVSVPLTGVESARRALGRMATNKMDSERAAASVARGHLDDFLENPDPNNVVEGDATQAAQVMQNARANWAAAARSNTLTTTEEHAENQQRPTADALRSYLRTMMDPRHPERMAGFSPDEKQAISNFMNPSTTQNTLGTIGRTFVGTGNEVKPLWAILGEQMGQHLGGESAGSIAAGIAAPYAIGRTANAAREALAARSFQNVDQLVRSRSPAYQAVQRPGVLDIEHQTGLGAVKAMSPQPESQSGLGGLRSIELPPRTPAYPGDPSGQLYD